MKELLFRGRFKVNKFRWNGTPREYEFIEYKTHHISAIHFNNNGDISHVVIPHKDTCITLFPDYFTTFDIQQYTGLKDKNEVKIFEGDILTWDYADSKRFNEWMIKPHYKVVFEKGILFATGIDATKKLYLHGFRFNNCEVIGNIYDNPDLIK